MAIVMPNGILNNPGLAYLRHFSEDAADTLVRLPLYVAISDSEVERTLDAALWFVP